MAINYKTFICLLIYLFCFISCNNKIEKEEYKLQVDIHKSEQENDYYLIDLTFYGPLEVSFNTNEVNFNNDFKYPSHYMKFKDLLNTNKNGFVIESNTRKFKFLTQTPVNVEYYENFFDYEKDSIYKIKLKIGENKTIHLKKRFSKEHFYFDNSEISKRIKFYYIFNNNNKKDYIYSKWINLPS